MFFVKGETAKINDIKDKTDGIYEKIVNYVPFEMKLHKKVGEYSSANTFTVTLDKALKHFLIVLGMGGNENYVPITKIPFNIVVTQLGLSATGNVGDHACVSVYEYAGDAITSFNYVDQGEYNGYAKVMLIFELP